MIRSARGGRTRRWWTALFVGILVALAAPLMSAPASAAVRGHADHAGGRPRAAGPVAPAPTSGNSGEDAGYDTTLKFAVSAISPRVITAETSALTISGTVTNTSDRPVSSLQFRYQLGLPLTTVAELRKTVATPTDPDATVTSPFQPFSGDLAAGQSVKFSAEVPTFAAGSGSLGLTTPGVFPLMLNVNGTVGTGNNSLLARVGALHVLLTVLSAPGQATEQPAGAATTLLVKNPVPVTMLWPIQDRVHLGVDGVFLDDDLAATIGPRGRLSNVLNNLEELDRTAAGSSATVVLDPELLDELSRMSAGYRVLTHPDAPQPPLTPVTSSATGSAPAATSTQAGSSGPATSGAGAQPTVTTGGAPSQSAAAGAAATAGGPAGSTTGNGPDPSYLAGTEAGSGQAAATAFLTRLRADLARHQILVLPYSDPDAVGLARAGQSATLAHLRTVGQTVVARELPGVTVLPAVSALNPGTPGLITGLAYPARGRGDDATLTALTQAGDTAAVLAGGVVAGDKNAGLVTITLPGGRQLPAVVADSPLLSDVNALTAKTGAGATLPYNTLAAVLAVAAQATGANAPIVVVPDRFWNAGGGAHELDYLLESLAGSHITDGGSIPALAAQAAQSAPHPLNDVPIRAGLGPDQIQRVQSAAAWIDRLGQQLKKAAGPTAPEPAEVLDPLREALTRAYTVPPPGNGNGPPINGAAAIVDTVERSEVLLRNGVKLLTSVVPFSLSATSVLPIGVQNDLPYDVVVRLRVVGGEQVGLTVTQPTDVVMTPGQARQIRVDAHVIRSGEFPVQVELLATDNTQWSDPAKITIKSNAYGVVILIVIWVAGAVLVLMVAFQLAQRVRKSRLGGTDQDSAVTSTEKPPEPGSILGAAADPNDADPDPEPDQGPNRDRPNPADRTAAERVPGRPRRRPAGRTPAGSRVDNPNLIAITGESDAGPRPHARPSGLTPHRPVRAGERGDPTEPTGESRES